MLANNEHPVVKLPQNADSVPPEPVPFNDDPPLDLVVQPPTVSPPDSETTPTESVDSEHSQSSPGTSHDVVAHPPHPAGLAQTPSNEPLDLVR